jgi:hypothetical protein
MVLSRTASRLTRFCESCAACSFLNHLSAAHVSRLCLPRARGSACGICKTRLGSLRTLKQVRGKKSKNCHRLFSQ